MPPPAHVSVNRHVSHVGIADVSLARSDPVGAVLSASDLIVVSRNLSRGHLPAAHPLLCYLVGSLQSLVSTLHRPGLSVSSCSGTLHDLPPCSGNTLSDRRLSLSQTIFFLASLPCLLALALALRLHTDLHWHIIAVDVLLCSRDLEVLLSHLYTARDSCAFLDETSFDSLVLHSQHIHIRHDVIDQSLSYLCRYVVFAFARQHVPQESNKPWVPFSHELPLSLRIPRSHLHCHTSTVSSSSRVCGTSAC